MNRLKEAAGNPLPDKSQSTIGEELFEVLQRTWLPSELSDHLRALGGPLEDLARLERFFDELAALGVANWAQIDLRVVRGLDYYTGIVFELFDTRGEHRAICGGGRYDNLLKDIAKVDMPALGFGMGDVVLGLLLRDLKKLDESVSSLDYFVAYTDAHQRPDALRVVAELRATPWRCSATISLKATTLTKQLREAHASGARKCVILTGAPVASTLLFAEVKHLRRVGTETVVIKDWLAGSQPGRTDKSMRGNVFTPVTSDEEWTFASTDDSSLP